MRKIILLPCLLASQTLIAGEAFWSELDHNYQFQSERAAPGTLVKARSLSLDTLGLSQQLTQLQSKAASDQFISTKTIDLPLPDGRQMSFTMEATQVMPAGLAERFPNIKTWRITSTENSAITGRIDIGPQGFHGMIDMDDGDRVFIDPDLMQGGNTYTSLSRRENAEATTTDFQCKVHDEDPLSDHDHATEFTANRTAGQAAENLLTYKLALAVTGEYTSMFGSSEAAMAAMVTTVNRLNQVFERDLSIHLQLVENNDKLIYTDANSDPYTNEDASAMVEENIVNINALIGSSNYDIGHVFGTGSTGGLAFLNSACGTYKAGGATGSNAPSGDAFNIDYVAHEIGHQLGASHTFNGHQLNCSAGNRESSTAVEPGSGSSIMSYAGICGTDNLQTHSDAFFHSASINQIKSYTRQGSGAKCGTIYNTENTTPTVDAGSDYVIPASTPFVLSGVTSDTDGDALLNSWEQTDTGSTGGLYTDLGNNPLFRVWPPQPESVRYFPRLNDLFTNSSTIGETLPTQDRSLNFALLSRDNNGGVTQDNMLIDVVNTGSEFSVSSQSSDMVLSSSQSITVDWEVANTNESPINCSAVDIALLERTGSSILLQSETPNDGSTTVTLPSDITSLHHARVQVACSDNIFFALSKGDLTVLGGDPIITVNSPSITEQDTGVRNLTFIVALSATTEEPVNLEYEIVDQATGAIVKSGSTFIASGTMYSSIQVQVSGDLISEENQELVLTIQKPDNAQFAESVTELTTTGIIIDDDTTLVAAASPDTSNQTSTSKSTSGGGGSFGSLSWMALMLLALRRAFSNRKPL
jgi:hypothetical protein